MMDSSSKIFYILAILCEISFIGHCVREGVEPSFSSVSISMPDVRPIKDDHYICTAKEISSLGTQYIYKFEPQSSADRAHHMILSTCDGLNDNLKNTPSWDCGHHAQACKNMRIVYAWAKNAPPTVLPEQVGFKIGPEADVKYLILQVHYAHPLKEGVTDHSGFNIHLTSDEPKYLAGIMLLVKGYLQIPPNTDKIHGDMSCALYTPREIHPFAYRVHTHKLGVVVSGYKIDHNTGEIEEIAKGNPQWPQAFYPMKNEVVVNPQDYMVARCTFSTVGFNKTTQIGSTAGDEMCNLYVMYYTVSRDPEDHFLRCIGIDHSFPRVSEFIPDSSDIPLPRNKTLEEHAMHSHTSGTSDSSSTEPVHSTIAKRPGTDYTPLHPSQSHQNNEIDYDNREGNALDFAVSNYKVDNSWPSLSINLGQATGVDFDTHGNIVVFHRGNRIWSQGSFDLFNNYAQKNLGPIKTKTVLIIHPTSGKVLHDWGEDMFYLPHGITVDKTTGDFWLTDVALHQVFKFEPGSTSPSMVLGKKFQPGSDNEHFCKPTAVAVLSNGDFFISDGYCNSRVLKFSKNGQLIQQWGRSLSFMDKVLSRKPPSYAFAIPHGLALAEDKDLLCVADRENGRIQCFKASDGSFQFMINSRAFGGRLFSVAYSQIDGGTLFAINGQSRSTKVQGFVIPLSSRRVKSVFSPSNNGFGQPHDIAVTPNGSEVYVVEITKPYKVWKFSSGSHRTAKGDQEVPAGAAHPHSGLLSESPDDSFSASVIIMAFLTIPLLLIVGVGAMIKLRNTGWCHRRESKSFAEFFPPSAGFEKLRMDESGSDNSDTEIEEFTASSYRKPSA